MHQLDLLTPYTLPNSQSWSIKGLDYRGSSLDIDIETNKVTINLSGQEADAETLYYIKDSDGIRNKMSVGQPVELPPSKVSLVVESELDDAVLPVDPNPGTGTRSKVSMIVLAPSLMFCLLSI